MTTSQADGDALVSVLAGIRRFDMILVVFLVCSQSLLYWSLWAERCNSETERLRNEQMHCEVMESLKSTRHSITQSVQVGTQRDEMVKKLLKIDEQ